MFFLQAEGGIGYLVRSRGRGDVYKRQENPRTLADRDADHRPVTALEAATKERRLVLLLSLIHI